MRFGAMSSRVSNRMVRWFEVVRRSLKRGSLAGSLGIAGAERLPGGAAEQGFQPDEKNVQVEGFGKVVISAGLDTFEDILGTGAGGEQQNRGVNSRFTKRADDSEPVGAGQHTVEQDRGRFLRRREQVGKRCVSIGLVVRSVTLGLKVEE